MENETLMEKLSFARNRDLWVSHQHRKAFSVEAVSDYGSDDLKQFVREPVPYGQFRFYFSGSVPGEYYGHGFEFLKEAGLPGLPAITRVGFTF